MILMAGWVFFSELNLPLVEAILSTVLSKPERRSLFKELEPVIDKLSAYGIDYMDGILAALNRGWTDDWLFELEDYYFDESLMVEAQLNILDRQNRVEDFLKLCIETGEYRRYTLKQIEVGEIEKAIQIGLKTLTQANDALMVAKSLRDTGYLPDAMHLAEKGLTLAGSKYNLGCWLGPIEETQGRVEQAVQSYQAAFNDLPSLELYETLYRLSGTNWESIKKVIMQVLLASNRSDVLVEVYLFEKNWDMAIAEADKGSEWNYSLIEKVADAVIPFRPNWVIRASRKQAERLIAKTQSKYYATTARWLAKMKQAYLSSGRKAEWVSYLEELKDTYSRRPALLAEFRKL